MTNDAAHAPSTAAGRLLAGVKGLARPVVRLFDRWSEIGTAGYPAEDRRRLKILNLIAALIVVTTGIYSVQNTFMDYERFRPIILINAAMLVAALAIPLLHRFGPIAGGLTLVACEYATLVALSAFLGRNAGLHLQFFVVAAATFVVLGFERLRLVVMITLTALVLHLLVWFRFTPETALVPGIANDAAVVDALYVQAAITTMALIAATVWYAFGLVEQARGETEALLRNVLPGSVVERLKSARDQAIADTFDDASVLFADISGFVPLARELGAEKVVAVLNRLVSAFDAMAAAHGIEKIKTIGDAYMAAAGLPVR
jgi:adenylate cyclase